MSEENEKEFETEENKQTKLQEKAKDELESDTEEDSSKENLTEIEITKQKEEKEKEKARKRKKILVIACIIAVAVLIAAITSICLYAKHYKEMTRGEVLYFNDGNIYGEKSFKDPVYSNDIYSWTFAEDDLDANMAMSTNGKYICYLKRGAVGMDLYSTKTSGKDNVLICERITDYEMVGSKFVYYASDDGFYRYHLKEKTIEKLCSGAETFVIDKKEKTAVLCSTPSEENGCTISSLALTDGAIPTILETNADCLIRAKEDLSGLVYSKESGLYYMEDFENKTKLSKEFDEVYAFGIKDKDKMQIYFLNNGELYSYQEGDKESKSVLANVTGLIGTENEEGILFAESGESRSETTYTLIADGKAISFKDFAPEFIGEDIFYDTSDKLVYFIAYNSPSDQSGTMYQVSYKLLSKGNVTACDNDVISIEYIDHNEQYLCKDSGNGSADLYYNKDLLARGIVPKSLSRTMDEKAMVFCYDVSGENGNRGLAVYNGREVINIGDCISDCFTAVSAKKIYYLQYGEAESNLLHYNGSKSKIELENIEDWKYLHY